MLVKKRLQKVLAGLMAAVTIMSLIPVSEAAVAAAPRISNKSITIKTGAKKTIKIKNGASKAKVTWKTSNKSVAKFTKTVSKGNRAFATVVGVKKGNSKITATYKLAGKSKKFTCTVKVKESEANKVTSTQNPSTAVPVVTPTAAPTEEPKPTAAPTAKVKTALEATLVKDIQSENPQYNQKQDGVDYGSFKTITYFSSITKSSRSANVFLPPDYDEGDEDTLYPVVYLLHGIAQDKNLFGGSINSSIAYLAGNAVNKGLCRRAIIVCPNIRVSDTRETDNPNPDNPNEVKTHSLANYKFYDDFREDLIDNLMPYMAENFHVATGRENTGVCGFSMGGREGLYIGLSRPDVFGYVGGFCPAVGLLDYGRDGVEYGSDSLFGSDDKLTLPAEYINNTYVQIYAGKYDTVVNDEPLRYYNALTANNVPVLYNGELPYGHEARIYEPGFYNFIINAFSVEE